MQVPRGLSRWLSSACPLCVAGWRVSREGCCSARCGWQFRRMAFDRDGERPQLLDRTLEGTVVALQPMRLGHVLQVPVQRSAYRPPCWGVRRTGSRPGGDHDRALTWSAYLGHLYCRRIQGSDQLRGLTASAIRSSPSTDSGVGGSVNSNRNTRMLLLCTAFMRFTPGVASKVFSLDALGDEIHALDERLQVVTVSAGPRPLSELGSTRPPAPSTGRNADCSAAGGMC